MSIGLQMDMGVVRSSLPIIIFLCVGIMILKGTIAYGIFAFANDRKTALKSAITLSEIGEFTLVVLSLLISSQMADEAQMQILMASVVLSMIATPFVMNNLDRLVNLFIKEDLNEELTDKSALLKTESPILKFNCS